jgi:hypothetical protein
MSNFKTKDLMVTIHTQVAGVAAFNSLDLCSTKTKCTTPSKCPTPTKCQTASKCPTPTRHCNATSKCTTPSRHCNAPSKCTTPSRIQKFQKIDGSVVGKWHSGYSHVQELSELKKAIKDMQDKANIAG